MKAMLSVKEVAELLGIRQHGVLTLIRNGELAAHDVSLKPGGRPRWRIAREEIESFLTRRAHVAAPKRRRKRRPKDVKQYF